MFEGNKLLKGLKKDGKKIQNNKYNHTENCHENKSTFKEQRTFPTSLPERFKRACKWILMLRIRPPSNTDDQ